MNYRENFGWSFWNRPFLTAVAVSLVWHFFWFFAITITVSPPRHKEKPRPNLVSLGPVLNDDIFRALVESRIEATPAFYRPRLTSGTAADLPVESAQRREPGDVISVPFGTQAQAVLAGLVGGKKPAPEFDVADLYGSVGKAAEPAVYFEGSAAERQVLFSPPKPAFPAGADSAAEHSMARVLFTLDHTGAVIAAEIVSSSGYPEIDLLWLEYIRRFQFAPTGSNGPEEKSEAVMTFESQKR